MAAKADKMKGIYFIKNLNTRKAYVGKSGGVGVALRSAKSKLKKGTHHNKEMQKEFFLNDGKFVFQHMVLDGVADNKLQLEMETVMDDFLADGYLLYNDIITFDLEGEPEDILENLSESEKFIVNQIIRGLDGGLINETMVGQLEALARSIG